MRKSQGNRATDESFFYFICERQSNQSTSDDRCDVSVVYVYVCYFPISMTHCDKNNWCVFYSLTIGSIPVAMRFLFMLKMAPFLLLLEYIQMKYSNLRERIDVFFCRSIAWYQSNVIVVAWIFYARRHKNNNTTCQKGSFVLTDTHRRWLW